MKKLKILPLALWIDKQRRCARALFGPSSLCLLAQGIRKRKIHPRSAGTARPGPAKPVAKKPVRWEKVSRIRDPSVRINPSWKIIEELDFSRFASLYFEELEKKIKMK